MVCTPAFLDAEMMVWDCWASRPGMGKVLRKTALQPCAAR